jgi:hypothetical protein
VTEGAAEQGRRWHDNRGELSRLVDLLEAIPPEVRRHVADALTGKTNKEFNAGEVLSSLKSLGKEKIMAMHQAGKKRRNYDQDPNLHQIVNTFFVLPDEVQEGTAMSLLAFTDAIVEYMANCDAFDLEPNAGEMDRMRDLFVADGPLAVNAYLLELHQPYYKLLSAETDIASGQSPGLGGQLKQDEQGLLLHKPTQE